LAGHATWLEAKAGNNRGTYRKAASLLREATKKNPRGQESRQPYNDLLNEMQDKGISETPFPACSTTERPTPAGIVAISLLAFWCLRGINVANRPDTTTDIVELEMTWNGGANAGTVTIELYPDDAPVHVENFKTLVENGDYDNTIFHRVIDDFMIQGGDFTNGDGTGGHAGNFYDLCNGQPSTDSSCGTSGENAWTVPDEADNGLLHEACTISMAKTNAPDTGGSQFFLIPSDSAPSWLDGVHTVFGEITSGCNHVTSISGVSTGQNDKPVDDVRLISATFVGSETAPWYQFW
jgi:cyclophilin family peptidyl-prolyl cis-trans isomerase